MNTIRLQSIVKPPMLGGLFLLLFSFIRGINTVFQIEFSKETYHEKNHNSLISLREYHTHTNPNACANREKTGPDSKAP